MSPRRCILPIFVPHAGCPNNCVFCDQKRISGSLFPASGEAVREAISALSPGDGYELAFYGGSFTAIPIPEQEELLSAAGEGLADHRLSSLRVSTRPDAVDRERLERLRRYGVDTVELGAQSMDNEVLRRSGRGHTRQDTIEASSLVMAMGFQLVLQMMTGLPGADAESDLATAKVLADLKPDGVRIYPTVILRDTALETLWRAGVYREHTVEEAVELCSRVLPIFEEKGIPVIRLGLNPSEELSGGAAVGGAYHPAFGELVRSRILRDRAERRMSGLRPGDRAELRVPPEQLSAMIGQHRCNVDYLMDRFSLASLRIRAGDGGDMELFII